MGAMLGLGVVAVCLSVTPAQCSFRQTCLAGFKHAWQGSTLLLQLQNLPLAQPHKLASGSQEAASAGAVTTATCRPSTCLMQQLLHHCANTYGRFY
jgi:hypothetical protein